MITREEQLEAALKEARRNVYRLQTGGERLCEALRQIRDKAEADEEWMRRRAAKALKHREPDPDWSSFAL